MDSRCLATTTAGEPCQAQPVRPSGYCYWHCPEVADERARKRREGGANRSNVKRAAKHLPKDLIGVRDTLLRALAAVEHGDLEPARAQAMSALARALIQLQTTTDIETRLVALEAAISGNQRRA